ncbi:hypothetical protein ACB092_12G126100 [Castanea dentata]
MATRSRRYPKYLKVAKDGTKRKLMAFKKSEKSIYSY